MPPRTLLMGKNALVVTSEHFLNGYQAGHLASMLQGRTILFTEEQLVTLLMDKLESMDYPERYCIGWVLGWLSTFLLKGRDTLWLQGGEGTHEHDPATPE